MVLDICIYWKVILHNFNLAIKGQKAKIWQHALVKNGQKSFKKQ